MDVTNIVAANGKGIRERRRLTLDAAAERTGGSRSMLSQIEKGDVNPTISVLWKIANGCKVSFTSLIEDSREQVSVLRGSGAAPLSEDGGRYLNYPAFPFDKERLFETYRIVIKHRGFLSAQPHMRGTEEYITVFEGCVEITANGADCRLERGDSIRFRTDVPHSYQNVWDTSASLSMLIYYNR